MHKKAENWAISLGASLGDFLGNGDNGNAYAAGIDKVIKITQDAAEYELAKELAGHELEYVTEIYEVIDFEDGYYGIYQERINLCPDIESYYEELLSEANAQGVAIIDIDHDYIETPFTHNAMKLLETIQSGSEEIISATSYEPYDIHFTNIGVRRDSETYVLFDQRGDTE